MAAQWARTSTLGALAALAGAALTVAAAPSPVSAAAVCAPADGVITCTFAYTNAPDPWTPDEVLSATVTLLGAGGGSMEDFLIGGAGGRATAQLALEPGAAWEFRVGGSGGSVLGCWMQSGAPAGGYNGGGDGVESPDGCESASGGGATDLRIGGSGLDARVLVAGGGGGGTNAGRCPIGGAGGGPTGGDGLIAAGSAAVGSSGGAGGNATGTTGSGIAGQGGAGVVAPAVGGTGGGGGGGGWYGGGGGFGHAGGGGGYGPAGAVLATGAGAARRASAEVRHSLMISLRCCAASSPRTPASSKST